MRHFITLAILCLYAFSSMVTIYNAGKANKPHAGAGAFGTIFIVALLSWGVWWLGFG